jgi:hypothetical protein
LYTYESRRVSGHIPQVPKFRSFILGSRGQFVDRLPATPCTSRPHRRTHTSVHAARLRARYACTRTAPRDFSRWYAVPFALMDFSLGIPVRTDGMQTSSLYLAEASIRRDSLNALAEPATITRAGCGAEMSRARARALIRRFLGSRSRVNDGECVRRATLRIECAGHSLGPNGLACPIASYIYESSD